MLPKSDLQKGLRKVIIIDLIPVMLRRRGAVVTYAQNKRASAINKGDTSANTHTHTHTAQKHDNSLPKCARSGVPEFTHNLTFPHNVYVIHVLKLLAHVKFSVCMCVIRI